LSTAPHSAGTALGQPVSFAVFRYSGFRFYFLGTATAMLADNVEHVITYWALFQKFHSPALGGFAVISHWAPFLAFSIFSGALADRFDPRRIIQIGMLLFMGVSLAWGILLLTDSLQPWHARVLLVVHGCAGVLWGPAGQLLLHDIVAPEELPSAVRLGATARYLGMLTGPAVGGALMYTLGPAHGILVNAVIYLPMLLWLWRAPYGPRFRGSAARSRPVRSFADLFSAFHSIRTNPTVLSMMLLAAFAAFFVGSAYQAQMAEFTADLRPRDPRLAYSMLFAADAAGALTAGFFLESRGLLRPAPRTAIALALAWCVALGSFAWARELAIALVLLFAAGFLELSFNSMAQALVQLNAPAPVRGRVIGVFSMAASGMRMFSGMTVGILGGIIGIHVSLSLSAVVLFLAIWTLWRGTSST